MGKQTNQKGSHFGGEWTLQKLHIIRMELFLNLNSTRIISLKQGDKYATNRLCDNK